LWLAVINPSMGWLLMDDQGVQAAVLLQE